MNNTPYFTKVPPGSRDFVPRLDMKLIDDYINARQQDMQYSQTALVPPQTDEPIRSNLQVELIECRNLTRGGSTFHLEIFLHILILANRTPIERRDIAAVTAQGELLFQIAPSVFATPAQELATRRLMVNAISRELKANGYAGDITRTFGKFGEEPPDPADLWK